MGQVVAANEIAPLSDSAAFEPGEWCKALTSVCGQPWWRWSTMRL